MDTTIASADYVTVKIVGQYDDVPVSFKAQVDVRSCWLDGPACWGNDPFIFASDEAKRGYQELIDGLAAKTPEERRQLAEGMARMKD